ncbi:basic helix-loop-helix (bHLH) DNA-bindingsuperfamily protein [Striga asiatica]|uniref:Basic helix-loop-helix (BHLH) DNA-bindingsuperfamily protein n=1 Tax=Striga asiatica TaxID=4170 RepID=A0A5A7PAF2_STRAF|nr:basic helix-loop-helix (bHLH) DNA-bindingsuperfamily protein [Striga asiatica]
MQHPNMAADSYFGYYDFGGSTLTLPEPWALPYQAHSFSPAHLPTHEPGPFSMPYGGLLGPAAPDNQLSQLISESLGQVVQPSGSGPFGLQTAQEIMDAKALAASRSHSEAERRRRERINNHLARLRSLLPSTTKTDKASLLAEVIEHVKELKRQTSLIAESSPVPTEVDELTVDDASGSDGQWLVRASICCEDRPDLLPGLINALKALNLKTLRAEITTLGGRVKNVLLITGEEEEEEDEDRERVNRPRCMKSIQEALRSVMERSGGDYENGSSAGGAKRQRMNAGGVFEYRSF